MIPLLCCCQHLVAVGHLNETKPGCNLPLGAGSRFNGMELLEVDLGCQKLCVSPAQGMVPMINELLWATLCQMLLLGLKIWWELGDCWQLHYYP